jgi:selenide, water dikinase
MPPTPFKLTALAHGGGCGCKLSPQVLREILADMPATAAFPNLLVGLENSDDAAVWQINDSTALIATTDFFMPIVDDPFDFGRIAAANALSDVYAMGGTPILALAICGMPLGKIAPEMVRQILAGGAAICAQAGIPVAGGHSIDSPEPLYGLVAIGLAHPDRILRNTTAQAGDHLILTKPLGVGVLSAALKSGIITDTTELIRTTTQLNSVGPMLAQNPDVHALTDVTGFGLLGHTLELCQGSHLAAQLNFANIPLLAGVGVLAQSGIRTGAAMRNWASYGEAVTLNPDSPEWIRDLLTDPQTSGGLLIALAPKAVDETLALLHREGFPHAAVIGELHEGNPNISF